MAAPRKNPPKDAAATIEGLAAQGYALVGIAKHFGVVSSTLRRWLDEDEALDEALAIGRETERRALHQLIVRDAVGGKSANANAMFLLKTRHGYREFDSPNAKVDVAVNVAQPVMVVKDFGTDEQWAAKTAAQQRNLIAGSAVTIEGQRSTPGLPSETLPRPVGMSNPIPASLAVPVPAWKAPR